MIPKIITTANNPKISSSIINSTNCDENFCNEDLLDFCLAQILNTNVLQIISNLSEEEKNDYCYKIETSNYVLERYEMQINSIFLDKLTCFDNFTIKVQKFTQENLYFYGRSKPKYFFLIDNKEIPKNIPIIYNNKCNCYLTKQIISQTIMNYNREYGIFLKNFMESKNNVDYKFLTMYEKTDLALMFQSVGRNLL